ncbi:MmcB family DNA repair protein [Acuticoccus sp. M5D2P5]|uniref:MmcB family DNA repair protein n=1 Tax=Acuticoccus kalidii TaxID=2910977 RepID=UPI001F1629CE|nr:MmcB family DNA repair protein [Acuticoccus kalidii]MCF3932253.1 MmcB family DNA repair protein [Acuticoccus kalidii]
MPLLSTFDVDAMIDGRQSPQAMKVRRGVGRLLREMGWAVVPELILSSGRRADLVAIDGRGEVTIVEIKSSIADFRADSKWHHYKSACDRLYFASTPDVGDIFPPEEGLIMTDGFMAEIVREAQHSRLAASTRRAMTLRIAQTAARRLHELEDPNPWVSAPV